MGNSCARAALAVAVVVVVAVVSSCGGRETHVSGVAVAPPSEPDPPLAKIESAPPLVQPAPTPPPPVEPTVLGDAERARDATFEPLARAAVDAYPNWNGLFT